MTEGQSKNQRRYSQRRRGNNNGSKSNSSSNLGNNQPQSNGKPKQREMVFHLHDSTQRKTSESFNKIVEAIIIKIEKTFDDLLDIVHSIETKTKKVFDKPVPEEAATVGSYAAKARKDQLNEMEWKILFNRYQDK